jgi:hypothetical protein
MHPLKTHAKASCETLYAIVTSRLQRYNQLNPKFIGSFAGMIEVPQPTFPAVYYWEDADTHQTHMGVNAIRIRYICEEECYVLGIEPSDEVYRVVLEKIVASSMLDFTRMMKNIHPIAATKTVINPIAA